MTGGIVVRGTAQYILYPDVRKKQSGVPNTVYCIIAIYALIVALGLYIWMLKIIANEPISELDSIFPLFILNGLFAFLLGGFGEGNKRAGYLPLVTEWGLLLWNMVFVYILNGLLPFHHLLWIPVALASVLTIVHLSTRSLLPKILQGFSYIWHSTMVICMGLMAIFSFSPQVLHENTAALTTRASSAFFIGTILFSLILSLWYYLLSTLPFVFFLGKSSATMRENIANRFSDKQVTPWKAILILLIITSLLILNRSTGTISDWTIVGLLFAFFPYVEKFIGFRKKLS